MTLVVAHPRNPEIKKMDRWLPEQKGQGGVVDMSAVMQTDSNSQSRKSQSISNEYVRAKKVFESTSIAVSKMFQSARSGLGIHLESAQVVADEISNSVARNPYALISIARLKSEQEYLSMHSVAVSAMMTSLANQMGLSDVECRYSSIAGLMHDIGKAVVPISILNNPGKLTVQETKVVRRHPEDGCRILRGNADVSEMVIDVCLNHHERMDGTGYPFGVTASNISIYAKMAAVCDAYDAITSTRPYKGAEGPSSALKLMSQWVGRQFDPEVFQAFVRCIGVYPVGALVRMSSDHLAVVIDQTNVSLTRPVVKLFFSLRKNLPVVPKVIDLSKTDYDRIIGQEDAASGSFPFFNDLWTF